MAILPELNLVNDGAASNETRGPAQVYNGYARSKPKAKVWGNPGIVLGGEVCYLPVGLAIDTMEPASTTGTNRVVVDANRRKNKVLAAFQAITNKMAPGETKIIGDVTREGSLVIQFRRVNEELEVVRSEGELEVSDIVALLTAQEEPTTMGGEKAEMQAQLEALQKALNAK